MIWDAGRRWESHRCGCESCIKRGDDALKEICLTVAGLPPPKDGGYSIFNVHHRNHCRVVELLREAERALEGAQWDRDERGPVGLDLVVVEGPGGFRGDGLNFLGGVADVLQSNRPGADLPHLGDLALASLYRDDVQVREARYSVEGGDVPHYRVRVWLL